MGAAVSRVAIAGLGPIGTRLAKALDQGIDGLQLAAVSAANIEKHRGWLGKLKTQPAALPIEALAEAADIVVECAPSRLVRSIVAPVVSRGKTAVVLSVGALLENEDLIALAKEKGGQIVVPTGALIGLDAMTAAAVGTIHSVQMVTRKPLKGLEGAPYLVEHKIDIGDIKTPLKIFDGTAREAARGLSRQSQCRGGAVAGGDRRRPHQSRNLGRPHGDAQHPSDRGRFGLRRGFR